MVDYALSFRTDSDKPWPEKRDKYLRLAREAARAGDGPKTNENVIAARCFDVVTDKQIENLRRLLRKATS